MTKEPTHGKAGTYARGCRCDACKAAHNARIKATRARKKLEPKDPADPRHGTSSFYRNHGCRCILCTEAASLENGKHALL